MAHMEITTRIGCKVACSYCPQTALLGAYKQRSKEHMMSLDLFKVCLDKLPKSVGIRFTGFSEPFLNPVCSDMILHAAEQGHAIRVSTTLVGMTPGDVKAIESVPFDLFNVHLPSEDSSEEVIPLNAGYLKTIKSLDESNIRVSYHCLGERVDPKLEHFQSYRGVSCITPNLGEALGGMRRVRLESTVDLLRLGKDILKTLRCSSVLLTRGEEGMTLFEKSRTTHIPAKAREVFDVTGAGDTVISVMTLALASGANYVQAASLANLAAGIVVGKLGTATVTSAELEEALKIL